MQKRSDTSAKLREDIDRGRGGDKIDWRDPAAAPLGTDDEAAGTPPTPEQLRMARRDEIDARPEDGSSGRRIRDLPSLLAPARGGWVLGLVVALALALLLAIMLT
jgi:hypothetical protein